MDIEDAVDKNGRISLDSARAERPVAIIQKCITRSARTYRSSCPYAGLRSAPIASCKTVPNSPRKKEILATEELHTRIFSCLRWFLW
ncbi:hypothetical protein YA62_016140 [Agrobacterium sp. LC34]|uniref:hypothetical protein n=1 Tax=Rhizobium/Agrobacterium group TaxID=227290 RepID=UPI000629FF79|nr:MULTISPECIES: hypothetical protein [Rhizobium/Agrobacterium group]KRA67541.1 hypothetical protein ASD85_23605 [Rhizobium sp. Root651]TKT58726.1 hypothetical protein YA62_016140 [Agrobacterium sp. LC34]